jgi:hypothetical protein
VTLAAHPAAGSQNEDKLASGKPEIVLSGIEVGFRPMGSHLPKGMPLAKIFKLYGKPASQEDAVVPDGAGGTRFYRWQWPGLKMSVATYFYYRGGTEPKNTAESRVAYVDMWGDAPKGMLGTTGRGLALGCTLKQQKAIYGDRYQVPYVEKDGTSHVEMKWEDGTFLMIDYGPNGRSNHIRLTARERWKKQGLGNRE